MLKEVNKEGFVFSNGSTLQILPHAESVVDVAWDFESLTATFTHNDETTSVSVYTVEALSLMEEQAIALANKPIVPDAVSKTQLKIQLVRDGIDLSSLVAMLPPEKQVEANIVIDNANYFSRSANLVSVLGALAGKNEAELDQIFINASLINPEAL